MIKRIWMIICWIMFFILLIPIMIIDIPIYIITGNYTLVYDYLSYLEENS